MPSGPPAPVKLVVSGGFGVGKTTLIGAISEIEPLTTEALMTSVGLGVDEAGAAQDKTTTTVAMDFGRLTIDAATILYLFGTSGQARFGFMWHDICRGALGGVVLLDTQTLDAGFVAMDYFESIGLPFVVAVNRFAGQDPVPLADVRAAANVDPEVPVVSVDARDRESVKAAVVTLLRLLLTRAAAVGSQGHLA